VDICLALGNPKQIYFLFPHANSEPGEKEKKTTYRQIQARRHKLTALDRAANLKIEREILKTEKKQNRS
jgi:hypothetical protein